MVMPVEEALSAASDHWSGCIPSFTSPSSGSGGR